MGFTNMRFKTQVFIQLKSELLVGNRSCRLLFIFLFVLPLFLLVFPSPALLLLIFCFSSSQVVLEPVFPERRQVFDCSELCFQIQDLAVRSLHCIKTSQDTRKEGV